MTSRSRSLLLAALAAAASSCTLLVPEELGSVSCRDEGAVGEPACARRELCAQGACRRCGLVDLCGDGVDNDCNGVVDDGCARGEAGFAGAAPGAGTGGSGAAAVGGAVGIGGSGGVAGKGGGAGRGGVAGKAGFAGKGGGAGKAGKGGFPAIGGFGGASAGAGGVAGEEAAGSAAGGSDSGAAGSPADLLVDGDECVDKTECLAGAVCASVSELGGLGTKRVCSRACRTSEDCQGARAVCFPTVSGTTVCLAHSDVSRPSPGEKPVGSGCVDPGECRSAWCEGSSCVDTCATQLDCKSAGLISQCVAAKGIPGEALRTARRCGKGVVGGKGAAQPCDSAVQCVENDCRTMDYYGTLVTEGFTCTKACCTSTDCDNATFRLDNMDVTFLRVCTYEGEMRACSVGTSSVGAGLLGMGCVAHKDCRSTFCLNKMCSDTCCDDSSCETVEKEGLRCLPTQVGPNWQLRCRLP